MDQARIFFSAVSKRASSFLAEYTVLEEDFTIELVSFSFILC
jgi:hypothetical protein